MSGTAALIHPWLDPAMVVSGVALGASWWARHAVRRPEPEPEVPLVVELAESYVEHVWRTRVAGDEENAPGALPGTWLEEIRSLPDREGWEAVIRLRPGKQSTSTAIGATDLVCSAFEMPAGSVIIEPTAEQTRSKARLQVIRQSELWDVNPWDPEAMRLDLSGIARVGTYADGQPAHLRWFTPGSGGANLLVAGAPGSGKSQFMSLLLGLSMRAEFTDADGDRRPLVDTYLGCGQAGQSFPDWARCKALRWVATTPQEITWMVWQFREMMIERSRYLTNLEWTDERGRTRHGMAAFDPVAARLPYAQLVIDEAAAAIAMHPQLAGWLYDIAKRGRKNGMRVVLATQSPSADELGGNTLLRSMLAAGGVIVFRCADNHTGSQAFPNGNVGAPHEIPEMTPQGDTFQGAAYTLGPDGRSLALMRTLLIRDPFGEAVAAPITEPPEVDARGGGELLARFWERQEARWAGIDPEPEWLARLAEEQAQEQLEAIAKAGPAGGQPDGPSAPAGPDDRPRLRVLILNEVQRVQAAHDRPATTAEVKKATAAWWSEKSTANELALMRDSGALAQPRKGEWLLAG